MSIANLNQLLARAISVKFSVDITFANPFTPTERAWFRRPLKQIEAR